MKQIRIISDGKPGHRNQSWGLAEALGRLRPDIRISEQAPLARGAALTTLLTGRGQQALVPPPDLLIGAGHATHLTLLALKRAYRVPVVVLMQPNLPLGCFDICLIPAHDAPPPRDNVILTQGALNRMHRGNKQPGTGMILIGGPSKHSGWDDAELQQQLRRVLERGELSWCLTTSRRTPESTEQWLARLPGIEFVPARDTDAAWLPHRLASTEVCWVTEDSVSMVYEALTAGCAVGTLSVPGGAKRLQRGLQSLTEPGIITPLSDWRGEPLQPRSQRFDEAARCAEEIVQRGII